MPRQTVDTEPRPSGSGQSDEHSAIAGAWLERVLAVYPEPSRLARFDNDPFRNPAGHVLREGLSALVGEVLGEMDPAKVRAALDGIVRLRAVQDFTPTQAVSFVFLLRDVLREHLRGGSELLELAERRIDEMALVAFDLYSACREKMYEIKANEVKRSTFVLRAVAGKERNP